MVGLAVIRNVLLCQEFNANGRGMTKKIGKSVASDSVLIHFQNTFSGGLGQGGNLDWGYQAFFGGALGLQVGPPKNSGICAGQMIKGSGLCPGLI